MKKRQAKKFLNPKSIAVIGASEYLEKVGGILMEKLKSFDGKIIPINPHYKEIFSIKCYPSILNYPKKIDLAIIAIPKEFVASALKECGKKKIKNVIVISAGFKEIGDQNSENELVKIAKENKINLLGPNCFGIVNTKLNLDTTFSNTTPEKGDTAFISQSGALWSYISDIKKLKFSYFISLGNMADLSFEDFLPFLIKDKNTKKIVLYVEKLKDGKKFIEVCKKSKKQIIVVKAGSSKIGEKAAISHTGSLATDFNIYKGAFIQAKIKQANSIEEAFNIKTENKLPKIKQASIITNAGGAGALLTDYLESKKIKLISAPRDILGTANAKDYEIAINTQDKNSTIIVLLTPQKMSEPEKTAEMIVKNENKKRIICFFLGEKSVKKASEILKKNKIKVYNRIK